MSKQDEKKTAFFTVSFPNEFREILNSFGTTFGSVSNTAMNLCKVSKKIYEDKPIDFFEILKAVQE